VFFLVAGRHAMTARAFKSRSNTLGGPDAPVANDLACFSIATEFTANAAPIPGVGVAAVIMRVLPSALR